MVSKVIKGLSVAAVSIGTYIGGFVLNTTELFENVIVKAIGREVVSESHLIVEAHEILHNGEEVRAAYLLTSILARGWPRQGVDYHSSSIVDREKYDYLSRDQGRIILMGRGIAGPGAASTPLPYAAADGVPVLVCRARIYVESINLWIGSTFTLRIPKVSGEFFSGAKLERFLRTIGGREFLRNMTPGHDVVAIRSAEAQPVVIDTFITFGSSPCDESRISKSRSI